MKVLAVYDDAPVFGGHEQMSCRGIEALLRERDLSVVCYFARENERLRERLEGLRTQFSNLKLVELPFCSRRFQGVRSRFASRSIRQVSDQLHDEGADGILVLQGDIELSSIGVLAGNHLRIPTVSYIPVPHTLHTMRAKLGRWRDPFNRWLFARPDAYITISEGMKSLLRERGAQQSIEVVQNGFDPSKTEPRDTQEARKRLGLPADRQLVGMVGRIEYKQKGQEFLLACLEKYRDRLSDVHLVYVGSGPDREDLQARARAAGLEERVTFIAWTDGLSDVYAALDVLALPSRFEGVPLVMLEAMSVGLPIAASGRDGMKEFLPAEWLFPVEDHEGCVRVIASLLSGDEAARIRSNQDRVRDQFTYEHFDREFVRATRALAELNG